MATNTSDAQQGEVHEMAAVSGGGHMFSSIQDVNDGSDNLTSLLPHLNPYRWNHSSQSYNVTATEPDAHELWTRAGSNLSQVDYWSGLPPLNDSRSSLVLGLNLSSTISVSLANDSVRDALSWWDVWLGKPFPSGYTQLAIVILAFFLTCIMILVVVGNLLVCIAIATDKALKPVQNWFIASLAVSDLFIGLVIMPFSLARELMGYWMFGQVWCDIHAALDVLLCTASINSLFLISLDRYWSITQAVKYLKKRTPSRAAFMIAFVWIFSALVSLPPLVGWKKGEQSSEYPLCNLSEDIGYVLYSSIGSFYFPALMMVFVYARIFIAARSRARKHIEKKRLKIPAEINTVKDKSTTTTLCTSFSNPTPPDNVIHKEESGHTPNHVHNRASGASDDTTNQPVIRVESDQCEPSEGNNGNAIKSPPPPQIIIETTPESRRQSWNIISTSELISSINPDQLLTTVSPSQNSSANNETEAGAAGGTNESIGPECTASDTNGCSLANPTTESSGVKTYFPKLKSKGFRFRRPKLNGLNKRNSLSKSVTIEDDSDTADSPTSKDHSHYESKGFLSAPRLLRSRFGSTLSIADYEDSDVMEEEKSRRSKGGRVQYHDPPVVGIHLPTDAERHKRKIAKARERRATLIVGLIMAAFITAWLPFFILYVMAALCASCKAAIPEGVFDVAFWLGYCNSAANPIIYTIFNRDYRKAFRKILFK